MNETVNATQVQISDQSAQSLSILLLLCVVAFSFLAAYVIRELKIHFVHESSVAIVIGLIIGLVVSLVIEPN